MILQRPTFIVFEGLDGSGKSTFATNLAERTGATFLTTPSPEVRRYHDDLVANLGSQEARQLFYLATVFAASQKVTALLQQGQSVILDRYFLSTQAYAAFRGSQLDVDSVQRLLQPADITIFLDVPLETRTERLKDRQTNAADHETLTAVADARLREEHFRCAYLDVVGRFLRVQGDKGSPSDILNRIVQELAPLPNQGVVDCSLVTG